MRSPVDLPALPALPATPPKPPVVESVQPPVQNPGWRRPTEPISFEGEHEAEPDFVLGPKWFQSGGTQGKEPEPKMKELMEKWRKAFGVPEKERIQLGKDVWRIAAEEVYIIGVVGQGPAAMGVRVVKNNLGNIPSRMYNSPDGKTPGISRPATFYWKN